MLDHEMKTYQHSIDCLHQLAGQSTCQIHTTQLQLSLLYQ